NLSFTFVYFHEGDLLPEAMKLIKENLPDDQSIEFIDVSQYAFQFKEGQQIKRYAPGSSIGYFNMCAFWSIHVWKFLCKYEYMMRLDDDCALRVESTRGNIFQQFIDRNLVMGYGIVRNDRHHVTQNTLNPWAIRFAQLCRPEAPYSKFMLRQIMPACVIYTNFGMTSLDFWRRPEVFSYMVQMEPFILRFRWGDAPLWFAAAATFAYPEQIGMVQNFSYAHGSHNTVID
ncbi:unnamed protein product, partial [Heterosigma akashiwo]